MPWRIKRIKKVIVLACCGTSYPSVLKAITNIQDQVQKAFSKARIKLAFTSNIIRKIWHERQNDQDFINNKDVPMHRRLH